jgi:Zn-finger protein
MMSSRFFENRECEYYPCHEGISEMNCLFCFCPLYHIPDCPGNPEWKEKDGVRRKSCVSCCFPHKKENYDEIMRILKESRQ